MWIVSAVAGVLVGCAPSRTFDVTIINKTSKPLTVGIIKEGPPQEAQFATVEQQVLNSNSGTAPPWGYIIPAGRTADSPAVTGAFPGGTLAFLRVYRGEFTNSELMAIGYSSSERIDVLLYPGHNEVVIRENGIRLEAQRLKPSATRPSPEN